MIRIPSTRIKPGCAIASHQFVFCFFIILLFLSCGRNESEPTQNVSPRTDSIQTSSKEEVNKKDTVEGSPLPIQQDTSNKRLLSSKNTTATRPTGHSIISFSNPTFDFGFIDEGEIVLHDFEFTNTGSAPLEIKQVDASCGCTKVVYPFTSVAPNETSKLSITYTSDGKIGRQNTTIDVITNAKNNKQTLQIKGVVR